MRTTNKAIRCSIPNRLFGIPSFRFTLWFPYLYVCDVVLVLCIFFFFWHLQNDTASVHLPFSYMNVSRHKPMQFVLFHWCSLRYYLRCLFSMVSQAFLLERRMRTVDDGCEHTSKSLTWWNFGRVSFVDRINNVNHIYIVTTKNHKTKGLGELNSTAVFFFHPLHSFGFEPSFVIFLLEKPFEFEHTSTFSFMHYWMALIVVDSNCFDATKFRHRSLVGLVCVCVSARMESL